MQFSSGFSIGDKVRRRSDKYHDEIARPLKSSLWVVTEIYQPSGRCRCEILFHRESGPRMSSSPNTGVFDQSALRYATSQELRDFGYVEGSFTTPTAQDDKEGTVGYLRKHHTGTDVLVWSRTGGRGGGGVWVQGTVSLSQATSFWTCVQYHHDAMSMFLPNYLSFPNQYWKLADGASLRDNRRFQIGDYFGSENKGASSSSSGGDNEPKKSKLKIQLSCLGEHPGLNPGTSAADAGEGEDSLDVATANARIIPAAAGISADEETPEGRICIARVKYPHGRPGQQPQTLVYDSFAPAGSKVDGTLQNYVANLIDGRAYWLEHGVPAAVQDALAKYINVIQRGSSEAFDEKELSTGRGEDDGEHGVARDGVADGGFGVTESKPDKSVDETPQTIVCGSATQLDQELIDREPILPRYRFGPPKKTETRLILEERAWTHARNFHFRTTGNEIRLRAVVKMDGAFRTEELLLIGVKDIFQKMTDRAFSKANKVRYSLRLLPDAGAGERTSSGVEGSCYVSEDLKEQRYRYQSTEEDGDAEQVQEKQVQKRLNKEESTEAKAETEMREAMVVRLLEENCQADDEGGAAEARARILGGETKRQLLQETVDKFCPPGEVGEEERARLREKLAERYDVLMRSPEEQEQEQQERSKESPANNDNDEQTADSQRDAHLESDFVIQNNDQDPEAPPPKKWNRKYFLRDEQRRALTWMLSREAEVQPIKVRQVQACDVADGLNGGEANEILQKPYGLEFEAVYDYDLRGGVLADKVGYGKTATLLSLLAAQQDSTFSVKKQSTVPAIPDSDRGSFFDLPNTTLVLVPSHLVDQWGEEVEKFVDAYDWNVVTMKTVRELARMTPRELRDVDLLICTYRVFYSLKYGMRVRDFLKMDPEGKGTENLGKHIYQHTEYSMQALKRTTTKLIKDFSRDFITVGERIAARSAYVDSTVFRGSSALSEDALREHCDPSRLLSNPKTTADDVPFPLLEQMFFKRIVFDEFHESEALNGRTHALIWLRSRFKWGLTGTPCVTSVASVRTMGALFGIDLLCNGLKDKPEWCKVEGPQPSGKGRGKGKKAAKVDNDDKPENPNRVFRHPCASKVLRENCQNFVDTVMRQNSRCEAVDSIKLVSHSIEVAQSAAERLLYETTKERYEGLGLDFRNFSEETLHACADLIQLCSHHSVSADDDATVAEEIKKKRDDLGKQVSAQRKELVKHLQRLELYRRLVGFLETGRLHAGARGSSLGLQAGVDEELLSSAKAPFLPEIMDVDEGNSGAVQGVSSSSSAAIISKSIYIGKPSKVGDEKILPHCYGSLFSERRCAAIQTKLTGSAGGLLTLEDAPKNANASAGSVQIKEEAEEAAAADEDKDQSKATKKGASAKATAMKKMAAAKSKQAPMKRAAMKSALEGAAADGEPAPKKGKTEGGKATAASKKSNSASTSTVEDNLQTAQQAEGSSNSTALVAAVSADVELFKSEGFAARGKDALELALYQGVGIKEQLQELFKRFPNDPIFEKHLRRNATAAIPYQKHEDVLKGAFPVVQSAIVAADGAAALQLHQQVVDNLGSDEAKMRTFFKRMLDKAEAGAREMLEEERALMRSNMGTGATVGSPALPGDEISSSKAAEKSGDQEEEAKSAKMEKGKKGTATAAKAKTKAAGKAKAAGAMKKAVARAPSPAKSTAKKFDFRSVFTAAEKKKLKEHYSKTIAPELSSQLAKFADKKRGHEFLQIATKLFSYFRYDPRNPSELLPECAKCGATQASTEGKVGFGVTQCGHVFCMDCVNAPRGALNKKKKCIVCSAPMCSWTMPNFYCAPPQFVVREEEEDGLSEDENGSSVGGESSDLEVKMNGENKLDLELDCDDLGLGWLKEECDTSEGEMKLKLKTKGTKSGTTAATTRTGKVAEKHELLVVPGSTYDHFGSKIGMICRTLKQIKLDDRTSKAIVFCQWPNLAAKLAAAFEKYAFSFQSLNRGNAYVQNKVIQSFQRNEPNAEVSESPEILIMNLEKSASGATLTRASHVLLVAPMLAQNSAVAIAYEEQAIGRVRRLGQKKKEIHVYRFFAKETVEQTLHERRVKYLDVTPNSVMAGGGGSAAEAEASSSSEEEEVSGQENEASAENVAEVPAGVASMHEDSHSGPQPMEVDDQEDDLLA